ncbi:hypothetical protein KEM56_000994 [Ascosphaera pollenicola]|nr:hypothetical protein KEM56_000994 [Ascosphaera pollenicola]
MADQGDPVEEDLFADLYDVDESTHQQPAPSTSAAGAGAGAGVGTGAAATPAVPAAAAAPASTVADVSAAIPSNSSFNNSTNRSSAAAAPLHSQPNQNAYDYTKHDSTSTSAYNYPQQYSHDAYTINSNTTPAMPQNAPAHQAAAHQETSQISSVAVSDQPQGTGIKEDGRGLGTLCGSNGLGMAWMCYGCLSAPEKGAALSKSLARERQSLAWKSKASEAFKT